MEIVEREDQPQRDLSVDAGVRRHLEAAIAHHRPAGPDVDFVAQTVVEGDRAVRRAKENGKEVRELRDLNPGDRLRATIRNAVGEAKVKAANAPVNVKDEQQGAMHVTAPGSWSTEARAEFNRLPESVRLSVLRDQNFNATTFGRMAHEFNEIKKVLEPARQTYAAHGLSDAQAVKRLFDWEAYIRANPQQALTQIASELGLQQAPQPQQDYQQQPVDMQTAVHQTLSRFAQDHPQFENVRVLMGQMLEANPQGFNGSDGNPDLNRLYQAAMTHSGGLQQTLARFAKDKPYFEKVRWQMGKLMSDHPEKYQGDENAALEQAYRDACKLAGYAEKTTSSKRAVSPATRSPSAAPVSKAERGMGIRASIRAAIAESRGAI